MNVGLEAEGTSDSKLITATGLCQAGPRGRRGQAVRGGRRPEPQRARHTSPRREGGGKAGAVITLTS